MSPKPAQEPSSTLPEGDADRPEYRPMAPPLALRRGRPQDGWQPTRTCAVCGQHIDHVDSWASHMKRLHPYAPRSSKHGIKRVVRCDPTNALGDQTAQRDAYMSTPAFLRGLLAWVASNNGQSPLSPPDPSAFQHLITQARHQLNGAKKATKVDRHLRGIKIVEDTINKQANSAQPTLDAMITALEAIHGQIAPLLSTTGTLENYNMISGVMSVLSSFFRKDVGESNNGSKPKQRDQNRLTTPPDSTRKQPQSRPKASQRKRQPPHDPPNFRVARLIRNVDGAGGERASEVRLQDPDFTVNFGDYLLHLDNDLISWQARFRNMAGQEGHIPRRMIQEVHLPWGLPTTIPIVAEGVGIPIAFTTEVMRRAASESVVNVAQNEAFLVDYVNAAVPDQGANPTDIFRNVVNVGRSSVTIRERDLDQRYENPWGLRVDAKWLAQRFQIIRGEEEEPEDQQLEDNRGADSDEDETRITPPNQSYTPSNNPNEPSNKSSSHPSSSSSSSSNSPSDSPSSRSAVQFTVDDLQRILDQDAATLNNLLRRPTVRAHKRYQRAIGLLQTRRDEIMKGRLNDGLRDRDRIRAAYRDLHDQMGTQLTPSDSVLYKELDCHEIVLTIIEILRRFEPEDAPLDAGDPDSPTDPYFLYGPEMGGNGRIQTRNFDGNTGKISQTNIHMGSRGTRSGKVYQTAPSMGRRPGDSSGSAGDGNDGDDDDGNGRPRAKRTRTDNPKLPFRKEFATAVDSAKDMIAYEALKKVADAAKRTANGTGTVNSNSVDLTKKNPKSKTSSEDGDYVPPRGSLKQSGPANSASSRPAIPKESTTAKRKLAKPDPKSPAKQRRLLRSKTSPKTQRTMPSPPASSSKRGTRSETKRAADDDEEGEGAETSPPSGFDKRARKRQRND